MSVAGVQGTGQWGGQGQRGRQGGREEGIDPGEESGFYSKGDGKPLGFLERNHTPRDLERMKP